MASTLAPPAPDGRGTVWLAFAGCAVMMASFYVLRPVRDTAATQFVIGELRWLFAGTFVVSMIASPLYGALIARVPLRWALPGLFVFWALNALLFAWAISRAGPARALMGGYFVWFSVVNMFMISVFWSLLNDLFAPEQAKRWFGLIMGGGSLGSIAGPALTRVLAAHVGPAGLLVIGAAGLLLVCALMVVLIRGPSVQQRADAVSLARELPGGAFDGFADLRRSRYALLQAVFMALLSWTSTMASLFQITTIGHSVSSLSHRTELFADVDLVVNVLTASILLFGLSGLVRRFGVTAALLLNPVLMCGAFLLVAAWPALWTVQAIQIVRRVGFYALAQPCREICFTVMPRAERYRVQNVIDTVVFRSSDLLSSWALAGLQGLGMLLGGLAMLGAASCLAWGLVARASGLRYAQLAGAPDAPPRTLSA